MAQSIEIAVAASRTEVSEAARTTDAGEEGEQFRTKPSDSRSLRASRLRECALSVRCS